ncbi:MAG: DUF1624 domain-containing protein [candidate division Zixibacteria bacterium]|nr:DUF1624 domain-containing protein [candidate division Zixibacteria bacterium]
MREIVEKSAGNTKRADTSPLTKKTIPRLQAIDVGRGIAMTLVILVHTTWSLVRDSAGNIERMYMPIVWISQMATPAFLLISGMMLGYLYHCSDEFKFAAIKQKLTKRAIILITFIHIVLNASWAIHEGSFWMIITALAITDIIGLTILFYIFLIQRRNLTMTSAVIVFVASWLAARLWLPQAEFWLIVKQVLFGPSYRQDIIIHSSFALLPLACIYHAGVVLGGKLARGVLLDRTIELAREYASYGIILVVSAVSLHQLGKFVFPLVGLTGLDWEGALYLFQKYPPSISFALFYSGATLILIALLLAVEKWKGGLGVLGDFFRVFGRTSLFTFAIQAHITLTIPSLLGIYASLHFSQWLMLFISTFSAIWILSYLWMRYKLKVKFSSAKPLLSHRKPIGKQAHTG